MAESCSKGRDPERTLPHVSSDTNLFSGRGAAVRRKAGKNLRVGGLVRYRAGSSTNSPPINSQEWGLGCLPLQWITAVKYYEI